MTEHEHDDEPEESRRIREGVEMLWPGLNPEAYTTGADGVPRAHKRVRHIGDDGVSGSMTLVVTPQEWAEMRRRREPLIRFGQTWSRI
jgi:hypothetical protein